MHISIIAKSPFYNEAGIYVEVFLNGSKIYNAVEFCTIQGIVWKYTDDLDKTKDGDFIIEKVKGKVTFVLGAEVEIVGGVLRFVKE